MKDEHQINCTNVYTDNLDENVVGQAQNGSVYLLSTLQSLLSEWMASLEVCTLYGCKNQTNAYNFLRIERVYALLLSVSFKPTFVYFAIVVHMLALWQF